MYSIWLLVSNQVRLTLNPLRVKLAPDVFFILQHLISTEVVGTPEDDIET